MNSHQRSILAVATLSQAFAIGVTIGIFPLMLEPLEADFSAPRTQISLGPVLLMGALCSAGVVAGSVLDTGKIRRAMIFGALLLSAALGLACVGPSLGWLALAALMGGFSIPFVGPLAGLALVSRTFDEDQGRAFGIMSMGPGLGSGIFAAVGGALLQTSDWRTIYGLLGLATLFLLVPVIWLIVPAHVPAPSNGLTADSDAPAVEMREVLGRPVFWWSAGVFALAAGIGSAWTSHYGAFLSGDVGMSAPSVASVVALQFWLGVPGALCLGILTDRMPVTKLFIGVLGLQSVIFLVYAFGVTPSLAGGLAILFGFATGGLIPLYMSLLRDRLEPEILGRAMGLSNVLMLPVMSATVLLAAALYESEGTYSQTTLILSVAMLGAIGSLLISNRLARAK